MISIKIVETTAFTVCGQKIWISGQDNSLFERFWAQANENGMVDVLKRSADSNGCTKSRIFGVSRVENDPENRAFDFYIATEATGLDGFDSFTIKGGKWAVFANDGVLPKALVDAEMEAFMRWLPASQYVHDRRPELEVYPEDGRATVEFWLPIVEK